MANDTEKSPVEDASTSLKFDASTREITLEQRPGEQPVTFAGAPEGPEPGAETGDEPPTEPPGSAA